MDLLAGLAEHYHWPHDFWRRMGWREMRAWLAAMRRSIDRQQHGTTTGPHSWAGSEHDPFWQQVRGAR